MHHFSVGSPTTIIDDGEVDGLLERMLSTLGTLRRVLLIPPDMSRFHSAAGMLAVKLWKRLHRDADVHILPAIGTHRAMTANELDAMFPGVPHDRFITHDWRHGLRPLGRIPAELVREFSAGAVEYDVDVELAKTIVDGKWDTIFSLGQLVPHEVVGIANHNKNVLVGCGGPDFINKSHFLGAVVGMERIMGRAKTPVRDLFNEAERQCLSGFPIHYVLTIRERLDDGRIVTRGLFAGDDHQCYREGAELCRQANLNILDRAPKKVVVLLDPHEFKSTWLGNKAVYRTRMAIADDGELVVLAPGVCEFGEDETIDQLIRKYGYRGTPATLEAVAANDDLKGSLSAAAHLIHGSSEGRFKITYCPGKLSREEIEGVSFTYRDLMDAQRQYDPTKLKDGWNNVDGEEVFFVSNPGLGLWGVRERF
jgi:nickel-dependent lactate racemase